MNLLRTSILAKLSTSRIVRSLSTTVKPRKAGVATDDEMKTFMDKHKGHIIVVDARNKNFSIEQGDEKYAQNIAGNPPLIHDDEYYAQHNPADRPHAINLPYDRVTKSLDVDSFQFFDGTSMLENDKDTPIITHCGGGGRGQKAKVYLESQGFTNVINGGGPSVKEHWALFGSL